MTDDINSVWTWTRKLDERLQLTHELNQLRKREYNLSMTCGSCTKWWTSNCPRERHNNQTGQSSGPSAVSLKCSEFTISQRDAASAEHVAQQIASIEQRLA